MKNTLLIICLLYSCNAEAKYTSYHKRDSTFKNNDIHRIFFETGLGMDVNFHIFGYNTPQNTAQGVFAPTYLTETRFSVPIKAACMFELAKSFNFGIGLRYSYNSFNINPTNNVFDSNKVSVTMQTLNYYFRAEIVDKEAAMNVIAYGEFGSGLVISNPSISGANPFFLAAGLDTQISPSCILGFDGHAILNVFNADDPTFSGYTIFTLGVGITVKY